MKFKTDESQQGKILLHFDNVKTNVPQIIQIDNVTESGFEYLSEKSQQENVNIITTETLKSGLEQLKNNEILKTTFTKHFDEFEIIINEPIDDLTKVNKLKSYIENNITLFSRNAVLTALNLSDQNTEMSKDNCTTPINIKFK